MRDNHQHHVVVIVVDSLTDRSIRTAIADKKFIAIPYLASRGHYLSGIVSSFPSMTVSDLSTLITGAYPEEHHIPGLVWFDARRRTIVNYGNNFRQTTSLGARSVSQSVLYDLNQTHLSKHVRTIFEELQDAKYSTGTINMLVYRGKALHRLTLPTYTRPFTGTSSYTVRGPDTFVLGQLSSQGVGSSKDGIFHRFGLNDDYATDVLVRLIKRGNLPDFTMVYLPDNDSVIHKHGVGDMKGIADVDKNLQKILSSYSSWNETLRHLTLVVMGDGGVTPVLPTPSQPTILLKDSFRNFSIYRWGRNVETHDHVAFAVNSRMAYVYLLNGHMRPEQAVRQLKQEKRIDLISWVGGNNVYVTNPGNSGSPLIFRMGGHDTDPYGQTWSMHGNKAILDVRVGPRSSITYGKYPDALHQLWSAAHCQQGTYLIVTAKEGYQFGDERAPRHDNGAQQASLLAEDVVAPMIVTGSNQIPKQPTRFVDLKEYFISLVKNPMR